MELELYLLGPVRATLAGRPLVGFQSAKTTGWDRFVGDGRSRVQKLPTDSTDEHKHAEYRRTINLL